MKILGWLLIAGGAAIVYMDYRHGYYRSGMWIAFWTGCIFNSMASVALCDWRCRRDIREFARIL